MTSHMGDLKPVLGNDLGLSHFIVGCNSGEASTSQLLLLTILRQLNNRFHTSRRPMVHTPLRILFAKFPKSSAPGNPDHVSSHPPSHTGSVNPHGNWRKGHSHEGHEHEHEPAPSPSQEPEGFWAGWASRLWGSSSHETPSYRVTGQFIW